MNRFQTSKRKTLMSLVAVLFTMLAGVQSAQACHVDPCPPVTCKGTHCGMSY
ncbi:MAG: hypothetical protein AABY62_09100 [Pseudomonadota bacterium]